MKAKSFLFSMLAAATLVGCSSDDVMDSIPQAQVGDKAYLAVNFVAAPSSRAAVTTPGFEDGLQEESAVSSARFYFFKDAECTQPYVIPQSENNYKDVTVSASFNPKDDNISHQSDATLVIERADKIGAPAAAVVILNHGSLNLGKDSKTLAQLEEIAGDYRLSKTTTNFVMTSTTYLDGNKKQLQAMVGNHFASNQDAALKNPVDIYVERVLAKVEVTNNTTNNVKFDTNVTVGTTKIYAKLVGSSVSNERSMSNLFKQINTNWTDTSLGFEGWNSPLNHRCYWAASTTKGTGESIQKWQEGTFKAYCHENTTATRTNVMVTAKLVDDKDQPVEVVEWMGVQYVGGETALKNLMANTLVDCYYIKEGKIENNTAVFEKILPEHLEFVSHNTYEVKAQLISNGAPQFYVKSSTEVGKFVMDENNVFVKDAINKLPAAMLWKGGKTYYYTDIKHFGKVGSETEYGVIRNHVYKINVTKVAGLGTPNYNGDLIPIKPASHQTYMAARINILSWKVVQQDVEL